MKFIDINGKEKEALRIRIIDHQIRDAINNDIIYEKWVEIDVIGRRGIWKEYMKLEDFERLNPEITNKLKYYGKL
jgi:hypothetical protein